MGANRTARHTLSAVCVLIMVVFMYSDLSTNVDRTLETQAIDLDHKQVDLQDKVVVVASLHDSNTSWVYEDLPDWKHAVYVVDDLAAPLHTDVNKGNEANVYLNYIITNYNKLPATMVFLHHHSYAFHIDKAFKNNSDTLNHINLNNVQNKGYVNLRCLSEPGCICTPMKEWTLREKDFDAAWPILFPGLYLPDIVLAPCCAQFAVSRRQVLARPKADYLRYLEWLMDSELQDFHSGRVMEHSWHIIFGQDAVLCPDEEQCYCETFGLCEPDANRGFKPQEHWWLDGLNCTKISQV